MESTSPRSLTITPELQRAMTRDLTRRLGSRWHVVAVLIVTAVFASITLVLGVITHDAVSMVFGSVAAALGLGLVYMYRLLARRAVALGYPEGSASTAQVTADALSSSTAVGTTEVKIFAFKDIRLTKDSVLLSLRASGGIAIMPRAVLGEEQIKYLHDGIVRSRR